MQGNRWATNLVRSQRETSSLGYAPRRRALPRHKLLCRPVGGLVFMAGRATVWDLVFVRHSWRHEFERMRGYKSARDALSRNLRHMASDTLTARTSGFVMRVLFKACRVRTIRRVC